MCLILTGIFIALNKDVGIAIIIKELLTPMYNQYWFITTYIVFILILPFLSKFYKQMSNSQLVLFVAIITIISNIYGIVFTSQTGYLGTFIYIYSWVELVYRHQEGIKRYRYRVFFGLWALNTILIIFCNILANRTKVEYFYSAMFRLYRSDNNILILFMSLAFFLCFLNMNIKHSILINGIAANVIGVYIFHQNYLLNGIYNNQRSVLWEEVFDISVLLQKPYFILSWCLVISSVFIIGWLFGTICSFLSCFIFDHIKLLRRISGFIDAK